MFALAVSPKDGGVWGATEAGLFRYRADRWTYYTRIDGLPSDQASSLAFSSDGLLYVGTQCDGIAVGSPDTDYHTWRTVPGPSHLPVSPTGKGLPSSLINCLLVASDGTVYAGTTCGLAKSRDGDTWSFVRGVDWKAKLAGMNPPVTPVAVPVVGDLLREDYVTCLAQDAAGRLWVGYRQGGVEVFDSKTGRWVQSGASGTRTDDYASAILPEGEAAFVGLYRGGLFPPATIPISTETPAPDMATLPALPTPTKPPTLAELNTMLRVVSTVPPDKNELEPKVVALDDDWMTEGDWLGRYGRYWACLNAICSPQDYLWGGGWEPVNYSSRVGFNASPGDGLRYWVQWLYTKDPRVLELPPTYLDSRVKRGLTTQDNNRREAEIDDHGEGYPQTMDGPHLYTTLTIPDGLFYLSLYDVNYNGHGGGERSRDYGISIRLHAGSLLNDITNFSRQPELAHGRIQNFWGGVWKRFLVRGPLALTIEINRNNSANTILPAVMLDLVDELPPPYFQTVDQWEDKQAQREKVRQALVTNHAHFHVAPAETEAANDLFNALSQVQITNSTWYATDSRRFYKSLLNWYAAQAHQPSARGTTRLQQRLVTCYYQLGMYPQWENEQKRMSLTPARDVEKALRWDGILKSNSGLGYEVVTASKAH